MTRTCANPRSGIQRLASYLVRSTPSGNVRVSTRFRFTQLSRAVNNGVPPATPILRPKHSAQAIRRGGWPNRNFLLLGTADGVKCSYCGRPNPTTPTIFDALDAAGATWAAYTDGEPFDGALGWSAPHRGYYPFQDFLAALSDGTLPNVSFVDGVPNIEDEHPTADLQVGEAWTRKDLEAAVASPLWSELAIIWSYDEAGGFADDVPPPNWPASHAQRACSTARSSSSAFGCPWC